MWNQLYQALGPAGISLMLAALAGVVLLAPFLLFLGARPLNGRRILAIFVGLFAVIIGANVVMAVQAIRSFPGLEVANSYVASQQFDDDRAAQQALGWRAEPRYQDGVLSLKIADSQGLPAPVRALRVTVSRPTQKRDDVTPQMRYSGGLWVAELPLAPGAWVVHLEADAPDGTVFRQRLAHYPGSIVRN